ncbi:MAG: protoporphyrinogen oxidase [Pseudomonadota bacterium]|nr:protoporphyrinogen oxidase [Pseudomonadota bacterium]
MSAPGVQTAVIGAGLAGLSAAVYLRRAGLTVRVYDPEPPGGKARTLELVPGWRIEWGPHSFTSRAYALFDLAEVLGIGDRAVRLTGAGARYLVRGGRLRGAPFGGAIRMGEGFGLLRGLFRRVEDVAGESVRAWVARRFGEAFAAGPLDAMMTGIWASDPATIEMEAAFPTVSALVRSEGTVFRALSELRRLTARLQAAGAARPAGTWGFPNGMGEVAEAARAYLGDDVLRPEAVTNLAFSSEGPGYDLTTERGVSSFQAVVVATEAPAAARLLAGLAPDAAAALGEVRYAPLAVAHWLARDAAFPRGFGYLSPANEEREVLGAIFVSDLYPDRAPPGYRAFATMIGGGRHPEDLDLHVDEVKRRLADEHLMLTGRPVAITGLHVVRHRHAVAPPALGHADRLARVHAGLPTGVFVAGSWCGAGAMDDAVRAGRAAALGIATGVHANSDPSLSLKSHVA